MIVKMHNVSTYVVCLINVVLMFDQGHPHLLDISTSYELDKHPQTDHRLLPTTQLNTRYFLKHVAVHSAICYSYDISLHCDILISGAVES